MKSKLLIVGAGGHGKVVADAAAACGRWQFIDFIDDRFPGLQQHADWSVVAAVEQAEFLLNRYQDMVVAIGNNQTRLRLTQHFMTLGFNLVSLVHPSAVIGSGVKFGAGTVVFANAVVNAGSSLGAACIVNTGATIDHDCVLADGVHVSPGANLAGQVTVGQCSWFGIGSCAIQQVNIGNNAIIGAGAAVICDLGSNITAVGVPAKQIEKIN